MVEYFSWIPELINGRASIDVYSIALGSLVAMIMLSFMHMILIKNAATAVWLSLLSIFTFYLYTMSTIYNSWSDVAAGITDNAGIIAGIIILEIIIIVVASQKSQWDR